MCDKDKMYDRLNRKYNIGDFKEIIDVYKIYDKSEMQEHKIFGNRIQILPMDKDSENDAEMLIRLFPENAVTIARMTVCNKGIGVGSKIIDAILNYAKSNNLETVYLESILSIEMINLALKYKFEPVEARTFLHDNHIFGDYKLSIF